MTRASIDDALFWGGDTTAAGEAAEKTAKVVAGPPPPEADSLLHWHYYEVCTLEQWRLAHGDLRSAPSSVARLRAAAKIPTIQFPEEHERCAELLDAWYATSAHRADALQRLDRVDSLQARDPVGITNSPIKASNLLVARLWVEQGDWPRAEAAARRRYKGLNPRFLSTHLREEGRAAASAGHRRRCHPSLPALPRAAIRPRAVRQARGGAGARGPGRSDRRAWQVGRIRAHASWKVRDFMNRSQERARLRRDGMAIGGRWPRRPGSHHRRAVRDGDGLRFRRARRCRRHGDQHRHRRAMADRYPGARPLRLRVSVGRRPLPPRGPGDRVRARQGPAILLSLGERRRADLCSCRRDRRAPGDRGRGRDRPAGEPGAHRARADHR